MTNNILNHLAIIMDGNGRWAEKQGMNRLEGHLYGLKNIKGIVEFSIKNDIKYLTLFAFSTENLFRANTEVERLIELFDFALDEYHDLMMKNKISFKIIGDQSILNETTKTKVANLEKVTEIHDRMTLIIAFNYGGRQDLTHAMKNIVKKIANKTISDDDINENLISENLYTSQIPDPELLIRTGGEKRLSNFLLWQLSYTELFFCDDYWPDFSTNTLNNIIIDYQKRKRNFGRT